MTISRGLELALATFALLVVCFLLLPTVILVPVSLTPTSYIAIPEWSEISSGHYAALFGRAGWLHAAGSSFVVAIASSLISTCFGTLAAIGLRLSTARYAGVIRLVLIFPMIIPQVLAGLAFYRLAVFLDIYDTFPMVILAHAIVALPFAFIIMSIALASMDIRLVYAARSAGAGLWQTVWLVVIPSNMRGVVSATLLSFIISWDEIVVTLFVSSRHVYTVPRRIWDGIREILDPGIAAAAVTLMIFTILVFLAYELINRRSAA